jgi:hypothetical protein
MSEHPGFCTTRSKIISPKYMLGVCLTTLLNLVNRNPVRIITKGRSPAAPERRTCTRTAGGKFPVKCLVSTTTLETEPGRPSLRNQQRVSAQSPPISHVLVAPRKQNIRRRREGLVGSGKSQTTIQSGRKFLKRSPIVLDGGWRRRNDVTVEA